jgi:GTP-binding protein LepA
MNNIRNFAIIAHIDHGKSTLADRLLEVTGTVERRQMQSQLLDSNPIERERGITIKLAPVRMNYKNYQLNLIDTPGHVDFSYEVSRSLAACEGAVLLIDATQGVQAQTLAHFQQARKLGLTIIPVVNKIDINIADVPGTLIQIQEILGFEESEILQISGKTGLGVDILLEQIVVRIPSPSGEPQADFRALVFNSNFDSHQGVIAWVRVIDGQIRVHDKLYLLATGNTTSAVEVGVFAPAKKPISHLSAGEVGYIVTGLKDISHLTVGETVSASPTAKLLPGYQPINPVVFVSFYPTDGGEIHALKDALDKLKLQDSALVFSAEFSPALGNGFRVGFLGLLHADVVQERLEREFNLSIIAAAPSVSYEVETKRGQVTNISKAMDFPDPSEIGAIREPIISLSIFVPQNFVGPVMQLCQSHRGVSQDMKYLGKLVELSYLMPLAELIKQFYDELKSVSQGFATLDYEIIGFQEADLVKMDILIAGDRIDALSQIVPRSQAAFIAKGQVEKLGEIIPRQQYELSIQAAIGGKVLARTDIKAFRKDVLAKMSGGDQTRKDKLLKKQKKGKERMKRVGRIDIPQEAFLSILKVD